MEVKLRKIYEDLEYIRVSLRKLGPEKRVQELGLNKIKAAKELYETFKTFVEILNIERAEYSELVINLCKLIKETYNKILSYSESKSSDNMAKFDLKTASSIIPVMDGNEETTEKIIQGIEMYDSCLSEATDKKLLITFVLKTRLTKLAKLKLKSDYPSTDLLIADIKSFLLTKQSANSLLMQINKLSQNDLSIAEYGSKLEELFINLTISQSNDNQAATAVLQPINEKFAIKRFSDGLRNRRLGTIIAARDYQQLKDAIRAAQDEEPEQPVQQAVMHLRGKPRSRGRWQNSRGRGFVNRGNYNQGYYNNNFSYRGRANNYGSNYRGRNNNYYSRGRGNNVPRFQSQTGYGRDRGFGGQHRQFYGKENHHQTAYVANQQTNQNESTTENRDLSNLRMFFRA